MAKKEQIQAPTPSKKTGPVRKTTREFVVTSYKQAIEILVGAGIPVNEKEKTMTWFFDKPQSKKVIKAGGFLDMYQSEQKNNFKTIWVSYNEYKKKKEVTNEG